MGNNKSHISYFHLTYNKFSYFSLSTPCRIDERRLNGAASNSTILNIQFALKIFIYFSNKQNISIPYKNLHTYLSLICPEASLADNCVSKASTHFGSESKRINNDLYE